MDFDFLTIPTIIVLSYGLGIIVKATPINDKYIPAIVLVFGTILGAVAYLTKIPFMMNVCDDIMTACAIGLASGLASTGIHQLVKQLITNDDGIHEGTSGDEC